MSEDAILRAQHSLYDEFCREDDGSNDEWEYDRMEEAEARWEMQNGR